MIKHDQLDIRRSTVMDPTLIRIMSQACKAAAFRLSYEFIDLPFEQCLWQWIVDIGDILSRCACNITAMTAEDRDNVVYIVDALDTALWTDDAVKALRRLDNRNGWHDRHMPYNVERRRNTHD